MIKSAFGDSKSFIAYPEQLERVLQGTSRPPSISCRSSAILVSRPAHKYSLRQTVLLWSIGSRGVPTTPVIFLSQTGFATCYASSIMYVRPIPSFGLCYRFRGIE